MTGDFNINWDSSYSYHSTHTDTLREIADFFNLELLTPINQVLMRYSDNSSDSNSAINLMFLYINSEEINTNSILPDL